MNLHTYRHCFGGTLPLWISFPCRAPCVILSTCGRLAWRVEDVLHLPTNQFGPFEVRRRLYSPFVPTKQSESWFPRGTGGVSKGSFLPPVASVRLFLRMILAAQWKRGYDSPLCRNDAPLPRCWHSGSCPPPHVVASFSERLWETLQHEESWVSPCFASNTSKRTFRVLHFEL